MTRSIAQNQAHNLLDVEKPTLNEYQVILSSGEVEYILAADAEEAAWDALALSDDTNTYLLDVRLTNEW